MSPSEPVRVLFVSVVIAAVSGCAPPGPDTPGDEPDGDPLAALDEREDVDDACDGDVHAVVAAASSCDPTRFGSGAVAADEPLYSICACAEIDARNTVTSKSGDTPRDDIGTNAGWVSSSPIEVDGTIVSAAELRADNTLVADGLVVGAMLIGSSDVHVRGDATVGGMEFPQQRVTVDGTLTVPSSATLDGLVDAGEIVRDAVDVAAPCSGDDVLHDDALSTFVDFDHDLDYEQALVGLSEPTTIYVGCGDVSFDAIEAANILTIVVVGHARVWIDGDVHVSGPFAIDVEPGASLQLFVGGRFEPTNTVVMGDPGDPNALHVWVGEHVQLASPWTLHGTVYAPEADMIVSNTLDLHGALFGRRFELSSPVALYDGPRFTGDACVLPDVD